MKDWKGNNIEVGHTVLVYSFNDWLAGTEISTIPLVNIYAGETPSKEIETEIVPNNYHWELTSIYNVIEGKRVYFKINPEGIEPVQIGIQILDFHLDIGWRKCTAICIKGISDNREEFMLNYFKVK